jgi:hypothetical protein
VSEAVKFGSFMTRKVEKFVISDTPLMVCTHNTISFIFLTSEARKGRASYQKISKNKSLLNLPFLR